MSRRSTSPRGTRAPDPIRRCPRLCGGDTELRDPSTCSSLNGSFAHLGFGLLCATYLASVGYGVAYRRVRDSIATNMSTLQEGLEGIRVVQAYAREPAFVQRFHGTTVVKGYQDEKKMRDKAKAIPARPATPVAPRPVGTPLVVGAGAAPAAPAAEPVDPATGMIKKLTALGLLDPP